MQRAYDTMRERIIEASALVEALIDFGEDQGIDEGVWLSGKRWSPDAQCAPAECDLSSARKGRGARHHDRVQIGRRTAR